MTNTPHPWTWYVVISYTVPPMTEEDLNNWRHPDGDDSYYRFWSYDSNTHKVGWNFYLDNPSSADAVRAALALTPEIHGMGDYEVAVHRTTDAEHAENRRAMESLGFTFDTDGKIIEPEMVPA